MKSGGQDPQAAGPVGTRATLAILGASSEDSSSSGRCSVPPRVLPGPLQVIHTLFVHRVIGSFFVGMVKDQIEV